MFAVEQVANWQGVIATAVAVGIPGLVTIIVATKQQNRKLDTVSKAVATSNGRTTGQYVEEMAYRVAELSAGQTSLQKQLAEHTVQDERNFAALEARLAHTADPAALNALSLQVLDLGSRVDELKESSA